MFNYDVFLPETLKKGDIVLIWRHPSTKIATVMVVPPDCSPAGKARNDQYAFRVKSLKQKEKEEDVVPRYSCETPY